MTAPEMNQLLPLYRVLAVIESLPRNEFGDGNYLLLDHAYRRCVEIVQTEIALQVQGILEVGE